MLNEPKRCNAIPADPARHAPMCATAVSAVVGRQRRLLARKNLYEGSRTHLAPKGRCESSHGWSEARLGVSRASPSGTRGEPPCRRATPAPFILAAAILLSLSSQAPAQTTTRPATTQPARVAPAVNPHWLQNQCAACHEMSGTTANPIPVPAVEAICIRCHDGRQARSEPHPVGRRFGEMKPPAGWPAPDNKVTCATCHEVHPGKKYDAPRPADNPMFLRGGGPSDLLAFCGQCHAGVNEPARRYNPHAAQIDKGRVVAQSCAFCHTKIMPSGDQAVRTGDPALRADAISLCFGCHPIHPEWSERTHIGAPAKPETLAALKARSATTQPASLILPLAQGDIVVCSTCHNPHYQGVFSPDSVLAAGAGRPAPATEQLRGLRSNLCGACHGK